MPPLQHDLLAEMQRKKLVVLSNKAVGRSRQLIAGAKAAIARAAQARQRVEQAHESAAARIRKPARLPRMAA
jgi:hypothetical protein